MRKQVILPGLFCVLLDACRPPQAPVEPTIEFTRVPPSEVGSPDKLHAIEGRVKGAQSGNKIVLFALSGVWWVQPTAQQPFTEIQTDSHWNNMTHPGSAYAALLVNSKYDAPLTLKTLPQRGGDVLAVATAEGSVPANPSPKTVRFSGYDWKLRDVPSNRAGTNNFYYSSNAWTDVKGFLHLRIARDGNRWTSAELSLSRSLGYGLYRFVVRDISHLEPAVVFSIFTYDESGPPREMDIEISRWGESTGRNAQYIVQPYYVPVNVVRFQAPSGALTHSFQWEPGRVSFKTARGSATEPANIIDEHTFTSGVPSPKNETVHMNLYVFDNKRNPLREGCEVVIEKFDYLP